MTIFEGEIVALIVAIISAVIYLIKISLQLKDYFNKIEQNLVGIKEELKDSYTLVTQEQFTLRQDMFRMNKELNYLVKIVAELRPEAFRRLTDFVD